MNNPSILIQGNILSSEIIEKIINEELKYQEAPSFGLKKNSSLRDEIGLAWSSIRGLWQTFRMRRNRFSEDESGTSETRNFWMLPFLTTLGYDVEKANAELIDNKSYAISHRAANLDGFPVHIAGINDSLDKKRENAGPRLSPHALIQEYLNKTEDHLYALVTNGKQLRLLRDSSRLVKLTFLEFNLEKMMDEEIYADFAILYRLLHATRMPAEKGDGENAVIEYYHKESLSSGTRIREKLSEAVEYAIKELANGFLEHPANINLRKSVEDGITSPDAFYLQSLRLVYRMLFLLVIEDRGLVFPEKLNEAERRKSDIYRRYYSMDRLRKLSSLQLYVDGSKHDLWENLKASFRLFEDARFAGKLGLQPLASGIFATDALGNFDKTLLRNQRLTEVVQKLCYFSDKSRAAMTKVNYGDLDVEEFGSVYEGLLEYKPVFSTINDLPFFTFEKGSERSSSGSHYTPEELVRPLIKHSLDYLIDDCLQKPEERLGAKNHSAPRKALQEQALLGLKVCDVACGSGHILLSAARRIATELARVRTAEEQPSPPALRHALRDTIRHTIYGVDKNPLAVELCKVALWLEAHNPGEPLNFLDHHIKCGDSIVGLAHRSELENGIADEAFKTLPGDEADIAAAFRKQNKDERKEREGKATQLKTTDDDTSLNLVQEAMVEYQHFVLMPETTPEQIAGKHKAYQKYLDGRGHQWLKQMADMQVAQFFISKTAVNKPYLLTDASYRQMLAGYKGWQGQQAGKASLLAHEKRFFHWFIEFPEVFNEGGFDCVLGNPPFLGGQKLSGTFGDNFLEYIKYNYAPIGAVDLVTYFFRRIFEIIKHKGFQSLISTNTIAQGRAREDGLDVITKQGGSINHAVKSMRWPGQAAVEVALVTITKQAWKGMLFLEGKEVKRITPYLDDAETIGNPFPLNQNEGKSFQGSIVLGKGFVLEPNEAEALITKDPRNKDALFPYLNGDDLNNNPNQSPSRWVINFFDWTEEKAKSYPDCYEIIERLVKPDRQRWAIDNNGNLIIGKYELRKPLPEKWWIYGEKRPALYNAILNMVNIMVVPLVSKYTCFEFAPTNIIYMHKLAVIALNEKSVFSFLSSSIHNSWIWKNSSTLGTGTLNYSTTDCFETFPFTRKNQQQKQQLETIGEAYHDHRSQLMLSILLGLTKTYNAFHAREIQPDITTAMLQGKDKKAIEKQYGKEVWNLWNHLQKTPGTCTIEEAIAGIHKLRELHVQMDNAVLEAYGWAASSQSPSISQSLSPSVPQSTINLRHDYYEVDYLPPNDNIRYTIHPDARKEVLKRLLLLNHQIFEQEARKGLHKEETVRKFYEQKGTPIPVDASKWFKKGKDYKKPKTQKPSVKEPDQGYGNLFD